ncbi:hypothetical protein [Thiobacillus sp.]|uniref:hypothetical protein n=1 Tax=Thiobacillus sp. TaxID=924 RepID=UPI0025DCD9B4|nr:hypothetical protein [Thiobacillus sp.]
MLHGSEIPVFALKHHAKYRELTQRAQGTSLSDRIEFHMCRLAVGIHGFVSLVPMAEPISCGCSKKATPACAAL